MAYPQQKECVRRIQTMAATPYGEIQGNLWHRDMKPMHLLRTKLSFFGSSRFDPKSDRWVRVTLFQGAPLFCELFSDPGADKARLAELDNWPREGAFVRCFARRAWPGFLASLSAHLINTCRIYVNVMLSVVYCIGICRDATSILGQL